MKKILISISALALLSFTTNEVINCKLGESITNIQDMKEWMKQDVESGNITPELGQTYIDNLEQVETDLIEYILDN